MPPIDALTERSLGEYGLIGTLALLGFIFAIVYMWKRPPPEPHASPMEAVKENAKLIPFVLEEVRQLGRKLDDAMRRIDQMERRFDQLEERSERMERLGEVIKDRLPR
ncbi:hypothetical protein [Falsirhodobacter sp. 20TX0035]|uniref:hypothetical protein n=1 Tax=Falsirhodobacter sp. 20TX0035 TaxID=3022019 RepID=UPI00232CF770|nr:hypothetical protein [Falsirhodobacter sp. 20TX0035]MDB6453329.1 hypothetical protein [Falsirhodobacter sp. 20TX0035]